MKKNNFFKTAFVLLLYSFSAATQETTSITKLDVEKIDPSRFSSIAVVQALNKTTAKSSILEIKIGEKVSFGTIKIIAHKCWQATLDQKPESKILLEVFEVKNEEMIEKPIEKRIFYGWIFASSPSISGLESPIYDITALNCKNK